MAKDFRFTNMFGTHYA